MLIPPTEKERGSGLTQEIALATFAYDPASGHLGRKTYAPGKRIGDRVGTTNGRYRQIYWKGYRFLEHRLIWLICTGVWPGQFVDHINMNGHDNRIANLRLASTADNNRNRTKQGNNASGYKGVHFYKQRRKWRARIMKDGVQHTLGFFDDPEEAAAAYAEAAARFHGVFARTDEDPPTAG